MAAAATWVTNRVTPGGTPTARTWPEEAVRPIRHGRLQGFQRRRQRGAQRARPVPDPEVNTGQQQTLDGSNMDG